MLNHAMRYVIIIIGCLLAAAAYNLFLRPMNFLSHRLYRLWHVCLVRKDKLYLGIYFLLVQ